MSLVLLFTLLMFLTLGVLLYFLRPSPLETAVKTQLATLEVGHAVAVPADTILRQENPGALPWLDHLAMQFPGAQWLSKLIKQAGRTWGIGSLVFGSVFIFCIAWALASLVIPVIVISCGVAIVLATIPTTYLYILREVRFRRCGGQLVDAVDLMARALRAGHAVPAVLEMVGDESPDPLGAEFRILHEEQKLGLPTREAIMNLVERLPLDDVRFLATAILVQSETGGNLAQILDKTANVMRERQRLLGQLRIYTAQGRISGWILCCLPFVMFGLISLVNPAYEKVLVTDPDGLHMLYAGLVMMIIGVLLIRKIIALKF